MRKLMTILTLCATLAAGGCHKSQPAGSLLPDSLRLSAGDVVFRRCTGLVSRLVTWSDERPDFQRMIRDSFSKGFGNVIVWKSDRIARHLISVRTLYIHR